MNDRFKFRVWDKGNEHYVDCADMLYIEPSGEITYACYERFRRRYANGDWYRCWANRASIKEY